MSYSLRLKCILYNPNLLLMLVQLFGSAEGFELKENQIYVFPSVGAGMHCNAIIYKSWFCCFND